MPKAAPKPAVVEVDEEDRDDLFVEQPEGGNYLAMADTAENRGLNPNYVQAIPRPTDVLKNEFQIENAPPDVTSGRKGRFTLPSRFVELPEFGYDASGWPRRIRCEADQSVMAYIPEGVFIQGKSNAAPNAGPEFSAYLSAYYIDIHEVTNENFRKYREFVSETSDRGPQPPLSENAPPEYPVAGVLWRDAVAYLEAIGKTLPTEAEWEKAARGAGGFDHPWGFGRAAWHEPRDLMQTSPIMTYPADRSPYGVFDMAGNVKEWCADWYHPEAYKQASDDSGQVPRNWEGPQTSEPKFTRVVKGNGSNWTVWHREGLGMSDRDPNVGFRGVLRIADDNAQ